MRMIISYRGHAHVRSLSSADIAKAYGIEHADVSVDRRVSRQVEVDGELGLRLIESADWTEVGRIEAATEANEEVATSPSDEEKTEDGVKPSEEAGAPAAVPNPRPPRNR